MPARACRPAAVKHIREIATNTLARKGELFSKAQRCHLLFKNSELNQSGHCHLPGAAGTDGIVKAGPALPKPARAPSILRGTAPHLRGPAAQPLHQPPHLFLSPPPFHRSPSTWGNPGESRRSAGSTGPEEGPLQQVAAGLPRCACYFRTRTAIPPRRGR